MSSSKGEKAIKDFTVDLRKVLKVAQGRANLKDTQQKELLACLQSLVQKHYWDGYNRPNSSAKQLYRKLVLAFHTDKYESYDENKPKDELQKSEIKRLAELLGSVDTPSFDGVFKVIGEVKSEYDSDLPSFETALASLFKQPEVTPAQSYQSSAGYSREYQEQASYSGQKSYGYSRRHGQQSDTSDGYQQRPNGFRKHGAHYETRGQYKSYAPGSKGRAGGFEQSGPSYGSRYYNQQGSAYAGYQHSSRHDFGGQYRKYNASASSSGQWGYDWYDTYSRPKPNPYTQQSSWQRQYTHSWEQPKAQKHSREPSPEQIYSEILGYLKHQQLYYVSLKLKNIDMTFVLKRLMQENSFYLKLFLKHFQDQVPSLTQTDVFNYIYAHHLHTKGFKENVKLYASYFVDFDKLYKKALANFDSKLLDWIHQICPNNFYAKNEVAAILQRKCLFRDFYLQNLIRYGYMYGHYIYGIPEENLNKLRNEAVYLLIRDGFMTVETAMRLSTEQIELVQYPGFKEFAKRCGSISRALELMSEEKAILYNKDVYELALNGIRQVSYRGYGAYFYGNRGIPLENLLKLTPYQLSNLTHPTINSLVRNGYLQYDYAINIGPEYKALLSYKFVQENLYGHITRKASNGLDGFYMYMRDLLSVPKEDLDLVERYRPYMVICDIYWLYRNFNAVGREKLHRFANIYDKFATVQRYGNGMGFSGLRPAHIANMTFQEIENYHHPLAVELLSTQGEFGRYMLRELPSSFFRAHQLSDLGQMTKDALFYAMRNNMPKVLELYWQHHTETKSVDGTSLFDRQKNLYHLYTMRNNEGQTLFDCTKDKSCKVQQKLDYLTQNYQTLYSFGQFVYQTVFSGNLGTLSDKCSDFIRKVVRAA